MLYLLLFLVFFLLWFDIFLIAYQFYAHFLHPGATYFPTTNLAVTRMLKLAQVSSWDTLVDLGSGDGRILLATARLGATAIGYEINPLLVWLSRRRIRQANLDKLATVRWQSFWKADFRQATVITVYLLPKLMDRLQRFLENNVNHPIRLVTNNYPFRHLSPIKHSNHVYLYQFHYPK